MGATATAAMFALIAKIFQKLKLDFVGTQAKDVCSVGGLSGRVGSRKILDRDTCENAAGIWSGLPVMIPGTKTPKPSNYWLPRSRYPDQGKVTVPSSAGAY